MSLDQLAVENDEEGLDSFYISFGDLMVILCVFLVMLLTMSKIDVGSFEKIKSAMTGSTDNTLVELSTKLKKIIETAPGIPGAQLHQADDLLLLRWPQAPAGSPDRVGTPRGQTVGCRSDRT